MKSSKKIIVAIIIILILLLITGGVFAFLYLGTDIFRTDKELFLTYFSQLTSEDGFIDGKIYELDEKKKQKPYETSGEITVDVEYPDETMETIIEKVNELSIRYSGEVDSVNQKVNQNIEIDYGNDVIFPINYRQDGNKFGLQSDELSKIFIAIKNENLKEFVTKFGIEDVSQIPDTIEISNDNEELNFTTEEIEQLEKIYGEVLEKNILDENFSSVKTEQNESYTLKLSGEQLKNIIVGILEASTQNTLIIDKINDVLLTLDSNAELFEVSEFEELIKSLKEQEVSSEDSLKITLTQSDKKLNQITIESGEAGELKIVIYKNKVDDTLCYNFDVEAKEIVDSESSSLFEDETSEPGQVNMHFNIQYTGLESLNNVEEGYEIGFEINKDNTVMKYDYTINANTEFSEDISIEGLDEDVAAFLNDYDETQLIPFIQQLGTRLSLINKNQMTELGLSEEQNPLLYSNPITMLALTIFNMASETVDNTDLSSLAITSFNEQFTTYVGEEISGTEVNALIKTVQNSNLASETEGGRLVKVTLDETEISEKVDSSKTYNIEAIYDIEGYVTEMKITTNN